MIVLFWSAIDPSNEAVRFLDIWSLAASTAKTDSSIVNGETAEPNNRLSPGFELTMLRSSPAIPNFVRSDNSE
jgi:hypothetical protein